MSKDACCPQCHSTDLSIETTVMVDMRGDSWNIEASFNFIPDAYTECLDQGCGWSGIYEEAVNAAKEFHGVPHA